MEWFLSISSFLEPASCIRFRESRSTAHHTHRFTDGERDFFQKNSGLNQAEFITLHALPGSSLMGLDESLTGRLKAMQRTKLVGSGTHYQGARAMSVLTFVPSPATWHIGGHCSAGKV